MICTQMDSFDSNSAVVKGGKYARPIQASHGQKTNPNLEDKTFLWFCIAKGL